MCREFDAVSLLRRQAEEDPALFDEYDIIYQDLMEVMHDYIAAFLHPEYEKLTISMMESRSDFTVNPILVSFYRVFVKSVSRDAHHQ